MIKKKTMAKPTTKKKAMTIDDLAVAIQRDFLAIRKDMATKADIRAIREEMATKHNLFELSQKMVTREEFRNLQSDVKMITDVMVSKADLEALREQLLHEMKYGKFVDGLLERLEVVEKKLGIKSAHRAA